MNTAVATGDAVTQKSRWREVHPTTVALTGIWLAALAIALFSPDLIGGSEHEHIPIGAFTIWFHSGLATAYVLTAAAVRGPVDQDTPSGAGWWTAIIWTAVAVAAIFGPEMVTGADPTRIPIAVLVAPIIGMVTTGFIAIIEAGGPRQVQAGKAH